MSFLIFDVGVFSRDKLTLLPSKNAFISKNKIRVKRKFKKYSVISIDINNMKHINSCYGYDVGTVVLKIFSRQLSLFFGQRLRVCRYSNDVFLVCIETKNLHKLDEFIESISGIIKNKLNSIDGFSCEFTVSSGIYNGVGKLSLDQCIDYANMARMIGKRGFGDTKTVFTAEMEEAYVKHDVLMSMFDDALKKNDFVIYFQPKINLKSEEIDGAEVLVRWINNGKIILPNDFISIFESSGLINKLDCYIVEKTCEFISENSAHNMPKLSINLSSVSLSDPFMHQKVIDIINKHNIDPKMIDIEITETAILDNNYIIDNISYLRKSGITISIDDFGIGASSLHRLKDICVDTIKIDKKFIDDCLINKKSDAIIRHIIQMSKDLNLKVVAEGIETSEQKNFLKVAVCDVAQGYFYAKPMSGNDFLKII